jgi:hypothetical protein
VFVADPSATIYKQAAGASAVFAAAVSIIYKQISEKTGFIYK